MKRLILANPSSAYEAEYTAMLEDWRANDAEHVQWFVDAGDDFPGFVRKLDGFRRGEGLGEGFVPSTTLWLIDGEQQILGAINIRHELNDFLFNFGGHIGYGIRPSARRKGYATRMLRLGLNEAKKLGLDKVLICCYADNIGSILTIEANGGMLENQAVAEGKTINRYWIKL